MCLTYSGQWRRGRDSAGGNNETIVTGWRNARPMRVRRTAKSTSLCETITLNSARGQTARWDWLSSPSADPVLGHPRLRRVGWATAVGKWAWTGSNPVVPCPKNAGWWGIRCRDCAWGWDGARAHRRFRPAGRGRVEGAGWGNRWRTTQAGHHATARQLDKRRPPA
ncbi:hypothetical protein M427DRAFT_196006 [Gonapodya prolifera JEL478]|uniref:Uncharacterized protein n=1 Tax=Gonapodya prolifera (strain JEL478) TaxID=1344416 RepID=A0A139AQ66_GONPJ|nr:hypothetical protein M427DRAFT_196006 [Gonapodya prolifera JEL478]|eukprot:KXS18625.1 hypothetical protein M427DRAFT_196006 [Gonapodya prolifera JEL478]